jgi:hypothetical protein
MNRCPTCNQVIPEPVKLRSTGYRSQNHRFRGHCRNIAQQLPVGPDGLKFSEREVADAMKRMAVDDGYPTMMGPDGVETPVSEAHLTMAQENLLIMVTQRFADKHGITLTELDRYGRPYPTLGGEPLRD